MAVTVSRQYQDIERPKMGGNTADIFLSMDARSIAKRTSTDAQDNKPILLSKENRRRMIPGAMAGIKLSLLSTEAPEKLIKQTELNVIPLQGYIDEKKIKNPLTYSDLNKRKIQLQKELAEEKNTLQEIKEKKIPQISEERMNATVEQYLSPAEHSPVLKKVEDGITLIASTIEKTEQKCEKTLKESQTLFNETQRAQSSEHDSVKLKIEREELHKTEKPHQ